MNAIEQAKQALEAAKHFTEDMHILPPEWCADESVKLKVRLESALAALSAPAQMTDAELPPMPEPGLLVPVIAKGGTWKGYTVEQMQDYALAAIESRALSSAAGQEPEVQVCGGREYCSKRAFCGCGAAPLFPERDLSKPAEQQGLFRKFDVRRVDGSDQPGGKHYGCRYYVLDLNHDQHAPAAMRAYAAACRATHPQLADDIEAEFGAAPAKPQEQPVAAQQAVSKRDAEKLIEAGLQNVRAAHPAQAPQQEARQARELPVPKWDAGTWFSCGLPEAAYTAAQMREYARAAQSAPAVRDRAAMIERIKDAVEGECGGLAINDKRASAILDYVLASAPAQPTVPVAYGLFWQLDDADYLQFPVFPTREECEAEIQSYGEGDRARMIVRPLAIAAAAPVVQGSKE